MCTLTSYTLTAFCVNEWLVVAHAPQHCASRSVGAARRAREWVTHGASFVWKYRVHADRDFVLVTLGTLRREPPQSTTRGSSAIDPAVASRSTTCARPPCARTKPSNQPRATLSSHTYLASLYR